LKEKKQKNFNSLRWVLLVVGQAVQLHRSRGELKFFAKLSFKKVCASLGPIAAMQKRHAAEYFIPQRACFIFH
jgi:hypothetical protein